MIKSNKLTSNNLNKIYICDLLPNEFENLLYDLKQESYRAKQIFDWIFKKGIFDFNLMSNLPIKLRNILNQKFNIVSSCIFQKTVSADNLVVKYALKLNDNSIIEAVKIYDNYKFDKYTICISTQVGCNVKCKFCQTGKMKFIRNLNTYEIIEQVLLIVFDLETKKNENEKLSNVVYMGMGEPLLNYEAVLKSIFILNSFDTFNISMRKITVSTVGIIPKIYELAKEKLQITLALSLHAPNDQLRNQLVPINKKYKIYDLILALKNYYELTKRRPTIEYVLISNVNDKLSIAKELANLLKNLNFHVNLITLNQVDEKYKPSNKKAVNEFKNILKSNNINVTIRKSRGFDINAACGMLCTSIKNLNSINLN